MSEQHTAGKVVLESNGERLWIAPELGGDNALAGIIPRRTSLPPTEEDEANGRRFVAAWNAVLNIPTTALEAGAVEALAKCLRQIMAWPELGTLVALNGEHFTDYCRAEDALFAAGHADMGRSVVNAAPAESEADHA